MKQKFLVFSIFIIWYFSFSAVFGQAPLPDISSITFKLIGFDVNSLKKDGTRYNNSEQIKINEFWRTMKYLDSYERLQNKFKGNTVFGFDADQADRVDQYKLNTSVSFTRGVFPSEIKVKADYGIILNNSKFIENISNAFIGYDYHPDRINPLGIEHYAFINRFTNQYLGVEQRYEFGVGSIFCFWSNKLTEKGKNENDSIQIINFESNDFNDESGYWKLCNESESCLKLPAKKLTSDDDVFLKKVQKRSIFVIKKLYSKWRFGGLIGIIGEIEKIKFTDSKPIFGGGEYELPLDFNAVYKVRWQVRPVIQWRPSDIVFLEVKPYFKFPFWWAWKEDVFNRPNEDPIDPRFDMRIDSESKLSIKLGKIKSFPNNEVSLNFIYNVYYDNAPNRQLITDQVNPEGNTLALSAGELHRMFRTGVSIDF